jgi:hypothetical protein
LRCSAASRSRETVGYNVDVADGRPGYKSHPLWEAAIRLAHDAYGLADAIRSADPDAAGEIRKAAVSVPARIAGALSAETSGEKESEAAGASAALGWLAARAESANAPAFEGLAQRARELSRGVGLQLGGENRPVC